MKWIISIAVLFGTCLTSLHARQYDEGYLLELIHSGHPEDVNNFFHTHDHLVCKTKHLIEFIQLFRTKVGEQFGYTPTWQEIYEAFKGALPTLQIPEEDKKWLKNFLKQIAKRAEEQELGSIRKNATSFDYRGDLVVDEKLDSKTSQSFAQGLAGALLLVIPEPTCKWVGVAMVTDAAFTMRHHWTDKLDQSAAHTIENNGIDIDYLSDPERDRPDHFDRLTDSFVN